MTYYLCMLIVKYQTANNSVMKIIHLLSSPASDFFCPVMMNLLDQPHLTTCCGMHLSRVAATRIQGACPLCKAPHLNTVLNKHFQRQVNALDVFCRHEDRGCGWQGELSDLKRHIKSCPMRDAPLMTDLLKLPVYGQVSERQDLTSEKQQVRDTESIVVIIVY